MAEVQREQLTNEVAEKKKHKNNISEVVDYVLSRKDVFTIYDVYAKFPGRQSAVQMVTSIIALTGLIRRLERGTFKVANEQLNPVMFDKMKALEEENTLLRNNNYKMSLEVEDMMTEVEKLQEVNKQNAQLKIQNQRLSQEVEQLRQPYDYKLRRA